MLAVPIPPLLADAASDSTSAVRVALITGLCLVLAAAVTAWGVTRTPRGAAPDPSATSTITTAYMNELVERARRAEANEAAAEARALASEAEVGRLRELLRYLRQDPDAAPARGTRS
jgi:hypothetical protein